MNQENHLEIWQVEVGGQIYEAPLAELPEWIGEGSLQPDDKVRKGNLRWIEARKVPTLVPFFNARAKGEPLPIVRTVTDASGTTGKASEPSEEKTVRAAAAIDAVSVDSIAPEVHAPKAAPRGIAIPGQCINHDDRASVYICSGCEIELCKACPSSYGGNVRICPDCGSMCRTVAEAVQQAKRSVIDSGIGSEAFGFADLGRAFAYPFRFKSSLLFGGFLFMLFSFGQSASAIGGIVLVAASLVCMMLANMIVFGVRAHVIDNFTQGSLDVDFMPSFEDFSLWDDVVHPFFLYIGAMISSFGPFFLVAAIGAYLIFSAASEQMDKFKQELASVPGTQFYAPDRTAEQSKEVREVLDRINLRNERRLADQQRAAETAQTASGSAVDPTSSPASGGEGQDLDALLQEIRTKQLEQASPAPAVDKRSQYAAAITSILRLAAPLVVFGMITFLWGALYYPAACAVAGYTRSFVATVNPLVGLDTIRRLGLTYVKILLMALLLLLAAGTVGAVLEIVLSPFDLPRVGNLPAMVVGSFVTFYFSVVFSCLLGFALFKSADALDLKR